MATYFFATHVTVEEKERLKLLISKKIQTVNDCHIWTGEKTPSKYGIVRFSFRGKKIKLKAHRAAYFISCEHYLSPKMHISHICHQKECVNVKHLSYETQKINNNRQICVHEGICHGHYGYLDCMI